MIKSKIYTFLACILLTVFVSSCGYQGNNRKKLTEPTPNSEKVWGDKKGKAKQLSLKYEDDATGKTAERIEAIRTKLYPK